MPEPEPQADATPPKPKPAPSPWAVIKKRWRGWLRAIHRDLGYLAVGFTLIYALSGLAINHIADWDPNFVSSEQTLTVAPISAELPDDEAVARVLAATGTGTPDDVFRAGDELRLTYHRGTQVTAIGDTGEITVQARKPRFFLRVANWLHYNRGKAAWTVVADIYAVMLLYLAISGIFMIKGRLGLRWRGAILVSVGVSVPLGYVVLSGGPEGANKAAATAKAPPQPASRPEPEDDAEDEAVPDDDERMPMRAVPDDRRPPVRAVPDDDRRPPVRAVPATP